MSEISITYDLLFDILKIEKTREDLQKLEDRFYQNCVEYILSKDTIINNPTAPTRERELTRIQLSNVKKLLIELYERREKKIINLALYKIKTSAGIINTDSLLEEEKELFNKLYLLFSSYRQDVIENIVEGRRPCSTAALAVTAAQVEKADDQNDGIKSVRFIKSVPRFMGPELETYGPFEENDIASLPSKIASILVRKQRAEEMLINN